MIAPAGPDDAAEVIALWRICGLTRPWNDPAADFAQALASDAAVLVARPADTLEGSVMVGFDGHRAWVYYLAVRPDARGRGVGRALMAAAETWVRARGGRKIQLMVRAENAEAMAFYEALGLARQDVVVLGRFLEEQA